MTILAQSEILKEIAAHEYLQIEHSLRHIIQDEQEHISELKTLMDI